MKTKPDLSFWKLWNLSFGFFGVQMLCRVRISAAFSAPLVLTLIRSASFGYCHH